MDDDGWFRTGDVAHMDADGFITITDRAKDVIKSGGEWISSIEIENLAVSHPAVLEAAVIATRHPRWQERPLLLVHRKQGADGDEARSCCRSWRTRSPSGGCPTMWCSSMSCRIPRPAKC